MSKNIFVLLDDKKKTPGAKTFYGFQEVEFKRQNELGFGVFFAVNEFDDSDIKSGETARQDKYCSRLRFVYADLDIAKSGDGSTREEKELKKKTVLEPLIKLCPPTFIIDTSNGIQPLWALEDENPTDENKILYKNVIKGIIEWSKAYGCKADGVFDTARILRMEGFFHQKEEPYMVRCKFKTDKKYKLKYLAEVFPYGESVLVPVKTVTLQDTSSESNPVFKAIKELDFRELIMRAFESVGRPVTFDASGHMIDPVGKTTGTFIGRRDDRDYLASSSHEPFKGNRITAVADILKVDYSDAYKWIVKEYNLDFKKLSAQTVVKDQIEKIKDSKPLVRTDDQVRFTWGTRGLDTSFGLIKPGNFVVAAAPSGSGKTTYSFNMAKENAALGHKVMFMSLEMDEKDIKDDFGRKFAGITVQEEYDFEIPDHKKIAYRNKIAEIDDTKNLLIKGIRRSGDIQWETIEELIRAEPGVDMVYIDNLDLISARDRENDLDRQKRIVKSILNFTSLTGIVVVLIHHYRKKQMNGKEAGLDEMSGSGKIRDGADRIIKITKCQDLNAKYPEKYRSKVYLQKGRGYPECTRDVYFIRGTFVDKPPSEAEYYNIDVEREKMELDDLAEKFGGKLIN